MKTAMFYGGPDVRVENKATPEPGAGEVVLADDAAETLEPVIFVVTKSRLPVPRFKIVSKLTQVAFKTSSKFIVIGRDLIGAQPRFQTAVTDTGGELSSWRRRGNWASTGWS